MSISIRHRFDVLECITLIVTNTGHYGKIHFMRCRYTISLHRPSLVISRISIGRGSIKDLIMVPGTFWYIWIDWIYAGLVGEAMMINQNWFRARFVSLTRSKFRLYSANHRTGYWSTLHCDWPSTAWAYSKHDTKTASAFSLVPNKRWAIIWNSTDRVPWYIASSSGLRTSAHVHALIFMEMT